MHTWNIFNLEGSKSNYITFLTFFIYQGMFFNAIRTKSIFTVVFPRCFCKWQLYSVLSAAIEEQKHELTLANLDNKHEHNPKLFM